MLTVYRSNRAEFLARLLSRQLIEQQPGPLETVEVMVNTWPTSRWLGEQLAMANGISSLVRFPFPGSRLRQLVRQVLHLPAQEDDPWRAGQLCGLCSSCCRSCWSSPSPSRYGPGLPSVKEPPRG